MHIADFAVGMLGANGIVGGGLPIATRRRARRPARRQGRRRGVLLRRRRGRRGRVPRGAQHRVGVEAADRLRLREQPVRRQQRGRRCSIRSPTSPRTPPPTACRASSSTATTCSRVREAAREAVERARGAAKARRCSSARPTAGTSTRCATRRRPRRRPADEIAQWKARDPIARFEPHAARAGPADRRIEIWRGMRESVARRSRGSRGVRRREPVSRSEGPAGRHVRASEGEGHARDHLPAGARRSGGRRDAPRRAGHHARHRLHRRSRSRSSARRACASRPISEAVLTGMGLGAAGVRLPPDRQLAHGDVLVRGDGPDRQPGEQDPLHVRRAGRLPGDLPLLDRRRHRPRRAALAEPVLDVDAPRRAQDHPAGDAGRREGPAEERDPRQQPGGLVRVQPPRPR